MPEAQFYLNRTAEAAKVPAVSPLLQSDALTCTSERLPSCAHLRLPIHGAIYLRTLEVQIPSNEETTFSDRFHYFRRPLPLKCQSIKLEHPRSMEIVYDAAIVSKKPKFIFDSTDKIKT